MKEKKKKHSGVFAHLFTRTRCTAMLLLIVVVGAAKRVRNAMLLKRRMIYYEQFQRNVEGNKAESRAWERAQHAKLGGY